MKLHFGLLIPFLVSTHLAQATSFTINQKDSDQKFLSSQMQFRIYKSGDFETAAIIQAANSALLNNRNLDEVALVHALNGRKKELRSARDPHMDHLSESETFSYFLEGFKLIPGVGDFASKTLTSVANVYDRFLDDSYGPLLKLSGEIERSRQMRSSLSSLPYVLDSWAGMVQSNPKAAFIHDTLVAPSTLVMSSDKGLQILERDPEFANSQKLGELENLVKRISEKQEISSESLENALQAYFGELSKLIQKNASEIANFSANKEGAQTLGRSEADIARENDQFVAIQVGTSLFGSLVGLYDSKLGHQIQALSYAYGQFALSVNKYKNSVLSVGRSAVGGFTFTANLLEIAIDLFNALSGSPSPEQIIVDQLENLRKDLGKLGESIHERFNLIDKKLNQIYADFLTRLAYIQMELSETRELTLKNNFELVDIRHRLFALEESINRHLEAGLSERPLKAKLLECFRSEQAMHFQWQTIREVKDCLNYFYQHSTKFSVDHLAIPSFRESVDLGDLGNVLSLYSLDRNMAWLARVVASPQFDHYRFNRFASPSNPLPNPVYWSVGTSAFVDLAKKKPSYLKIGNEKLLNNLFSQGEQLESFLRELTVISRDGQTKPNLKFWERLFEIYGEHLKSLNAIIPQLRAEINREVFHGVDPWKGAEQDVVVDLTPNLVHLLRDNVSLSSTPEVMKLLPPKYRVAAALGLCELTGFVELLDHDARWDRNNRYLRKKMKVEFRSKCKGNGAVPDYRFHRRVYIAPNETPDVVNGVYVRNITWIEDLESNWVSKDNYFDKLINETRAECDFKPSTVSFENLFHFDESLSVLLNSAKVEATNRLKSHLQQGCGDSKLGSSLPSCAVVSELKALSGMAELIRTLVVLGLPDTIGNRDDLRSMYFGKGRIADTASIIEALESDPTHEIASGIESELEARFKETRDLTLNVIGRLKTAEMEPMMATVLRELRALKTRVEMERPETSIEQVFFELHDIVSELRAKGDR